MGDVSSRRGMIEGQEERGNAVSVQASVPLSEMFGYAACPSFDNTVVIAAVKVVLPWST